MSWLGDGWLGSDAMFAAPPMDYWAPQAGAVIDANLRQAKQRAEQYRLRSARRRMQLLEDDWKDILLEKLCQIYTTERVQSTMLGQLSVEHNIFKRICQELSTVYRYGVTRELRDKRQEAIARDLWEQVEIDERLERANLFVNGVRDVLIAPIVVGGKMQLWLIPPDRTVVMQNPEDPTEALAFWTERVLQNSPGHIGYQRVYADHEKWILGDPYGGQPRVIHHNLGRLPAVVVHATQRYDSFWAPFEGEDLYDATLNLGVDFFRFARVLQFQTELQPTFDGPPKNIAKGMGIGGDTIWAGEGTWGVLNLQADPNKLIETIRFRVGMIAEQYGLAADIYDLSSNPTSGFQIRMKRLPLLEARQRQIKVWRRIEKQLLRLMALVSQRFHPTLRLDPEAAELSTLTFHDEPGLVEPLTQNRTWRERIELGLMSEIDAYMAANPDVSREEARAKIKRAYAESAALAEMAATRNIPVGGKVGAGPGNAPATAQQNGAKGGAASDDPAQAADANAAQPRQVGKADFSSSDQEG